MAVNRAHGPAEGGPLFGKRLVVHHVLGAAGDLQRVAVDDGGEVIQFVMSPGERAFPVRAFGEFTVAEQRESAEACVVELARQRGADGDGQAVTERARVLLDAGDVARRMPHVVGLIAAKRFEVRLGEESTVGEHDEQRFDGVTLALDVAVALRVRERRGRDPEDAVVEDV